MKEVYSYLEVGTEIDQGKQVVFTCYPEVRVTCVQRDPETETIKVTLMVLIRDNCVGILDYEFTSIQAVLDAFDINEDSEIWEVLQ